MGREVGEADRMRRGRERGWDEECREGREGEERRLNYHIKCCLKTCTHLM